MYFCSDLYFCVALISSFALSSAYQVVVVEEDGSRQVRRRELGSVDCFPSPNSHNEAQVKGSPHYYTAELAPSSLPEATPFTVGDNHTYNGYWNSPLDPTKNYLIYFQATSNFRGVGTIITLILLLYRHFYNPDTHLRLRLRKRVVSSINQVDKYKKG